jgi:hypothetical protein
MTFKKSDNSLVSLGVGQVALITKWLDEMGVTGYIINDDLTININGDVDLDSKNLEKFPSYIKFGRVGGYFSCSNNHLVSLEGCPREVGGGFYCGNNQLVSLEGSPREVGGSFSCSNNKKKFSEEEVRKVCKVKRDIYV